MKKAIIWSFILAILHSILFYGKNMGISVILFTIPTILLLVLFLKGNNKIKNARALYLTIPIILLSSTYCLFNNNFFSVINIIILPLLIGVMIVWAVTDEFILKKILSKSITLIIGSLEFIPNSIKLIKETITNRKKDEETAKNKKIKAIGIGIVCSIPILLIILALLISADGIFAELFGELANKIMYIFTSEFIIMIIFRIILILIVAIYLICIMYNIINNNSSFNISITRTRDRKFEIDTTIINTILSMINVVYLIFCGIQLMYLFGNSIFKMNLSLAQYARQGFFQLMIVTFINFVIIITTNLNKKEASIKSKNYTKIMNVLMSIFTAVIAVSAFIRMNLYEQEYGYTFLRLMVYIILTTEILMIIPTIYYIVKGKINLFKSYFIIVLTMYVFVNFINIDALIAKNNIDRYLSEGKNTREIDFYYLKEYTGIDAIPEIVRLYSKENDPDLKRRINNYLYNTYEELKEKRDWQEFNIGKEKAQKSLEELNLTYKNII